jgi:hypothetical protein
MPGDLIDDCRRCMESRIENVIGAALDAKKPRYGYKKTHARAIRFGLEKSIAPDLFATDTTVVLTWPFTRRASFRTITTSTADFGSRSVEAVTM